MDVQCVSAEGVLFKFEESVFFKILKDDQKTYKEFMTYCKDNELL